MATSRRSSEIWDNQLRRTVLISTAFLLCGVLLSWQLGKIMGREVADERPADASSREAALWSDIQFLAPGYPSDLRDEVVEMGWRVCDKFSAGWDPTRVLSLISQPDNSTSSPQVSNSSPSEVRFWIGVEQSAVHRLCPQYEEKIAGWPQDVAREVWHASRPTQAA